LILYPHSGKANQKSHDPNRPKNFHGGYAGRLDSNDLVLSRYPAVNAANREQKGRWQAELQSHDQNVGEQFDDRKIRNSLAHHFFADQNQTDQCGHAGQSDREDFHNVAQDVPSKFARNHPRSLAIPASETDPSFGEVAGDYVALGAGE
jgi:hypothetical protein